MVVIANSHVSARRSIELPQPQQQSKEDAAADVALMASTEAANVSENEASAWTAALLPLVKGKTKMDKAKLAQTSDALGEVERANWRGSTAREVLKVSKRQRSVCGPPPPLPKGFCLLTLTRKTIICFFLFFFRRARWQIRCGDLASWRVSRWGTCMVCVCVHGRWRSGGGRRLGAASSTCSKGFCYVCLRPSVQCVGGQCARPGLALGRRCFRFISFLVG